MKFVATKYVDKLDLQALRRVGVRLVSKRAGIVKQIRAFLLERGVAVRQGHACCASNFRDSWPALPTSCRHAWRASSRARRRLAAAR